MFIEHKWSHEDRFQHDFRVNVSIRTQIGIINNRHISADLLEELPLLTTVSVVSVKWLLRSLPLSSKLVKTIILGVGLKEIDRLL